MLGLASGLLGDPKRHLPTRALMQLAADNPAALNRRVPKNFPNGSAARIGDN